MPEIQIFTLSGFQPLKKGLVEVLPQEVVLCYLRQE